MVEGDIVGVWAVQYEMFEDSGYPECIVECSHFRLSVLFDTVASISLFPASSVRSGISLVSQELWVPVMCGTFNMSCEGQLLQGQETMQVVPPVAKEFCMVPIKLWGVTCVFPLHVLPMLCPMIILGIDFLRCMKFNVLIDNSEIIVFCPQSLLHNLKVFKAFVSDRGVKVGHEYSVRLQGGSFRGGLAPEFCKLIRGLLVCAHEQPMFLVQTHCWLAGVLRRVALRAPG